MTASTDLASASRIFYPPTAPGVETFKFDDSPLLKKALTSIAPPHYPLEEAKTEGSDILAGSPFGDKSRVGSSKDDSTTHRHDNATYLAPVSEGQFVFLNG